MQKKLVALMLALCVLPAAGIAAEEATQSPVGAWKLISIEYTGPKGPSPDGVFGAGPQGLLVYDASGWMSVQIHAANRPTMTEPASRTTGVNSPADAQLKAAALDSYYAYYATWEFDAAKGIVIHHVKSSVLPYEIGRDLKRQVSLQGNRLVLTVPSEVNGEPRKRVLTWERISGG